MNKIGKQSINSINNNESSLQQSRQVQNNDFEFDDVQEYEEEFDELEKSNQKENGSKVVGKDNVTNGLNKSSKVEGIVKARQERAENVIPLKQSINKIEAPSKQNNWNQSKKVTSSVQYQQQQIIGGNKQKNQQHQEQFEDINMQDHQQQDDQQPQIIQNQQPQQQSFTLLSNKNHAQVTNNDKQKLKTEPKQPLPQLSKQQLSHMIYENQKVIKQLKQKTSNYRQEIKNISNLVDKDIHKSIVKISNNKHAINIKNIFNEVYTSENPNITKLREELLSIRNQSKLLKAQITSIEDKLNDPISHENTLKHQQLQTKLKILSIEVNKTKEEKHFATTEVQRMKQSSGLVQFEHFQKSINKNQETLSKILNEIKEERAKIYKLEKQDIFYMEKLKFLTENHQKLQSSLALEKSIQQKPTPQQLKKNIQSLLNQINFILQHRNTIENDKNKLIKSLNAQIESMENKNLVIMNQVRNIDASLLQFYTHKAHKKHSLNKVPKTAEKLHETIDSGSPILRQKHNQTSQQIPNDKNPQDKPMAVSVSSSMNKFRSKIHVKKNPINQKSNDNKISAFIQRQQLQQEDHMQKQQTKDLKVKNQPKEKTSEQDEIFTESKSILSFGDLKVDEKGAILSDQILGKVKIRQIHFFVDKKNLYGVHCKYFNHEKPQIFGMKICQKNADQKCDKISLVLTEQKDQRISSIKVGYSLRNQIKLIEITTSLQKSLKWSVQNEVTLSQTKSIQKYSSFCIKAKLISTEDIPSTSKSLNELMIDRPKLKLAGLGFSVVQLIKQSTK